MFRIECALVAKGASFLGARMGLVAQYCGDFKHESPDITTSDRLLDDLFQIQIWFHSNPYLFVCHRVPLMGVANGSTFVRLCAGVLGQVFWSTIPHAHTQTASC